MQTVPHHHLTHHFWERETVSPKLPFLYRESMSRHPSGTHHSSRLDALENQEGRFLRERQHPWQHPDNIHWKKNTEQNEYVPSRRALDRIFPLKPVLHKRAFSLSNVTKPEHQERLYSCLPALPAVRHQQKPGRKLDPLNLDREHQEHKQTHFSKEIHSKEIMLQQKIFKAEETLRRIHKETKERNQSYFEDNRLYNNGYSDWDEERHRYGNGRDDMERWEREVERRRIREGRRRPLILEMAKIHKMEEKREWDDYKHEGWSRETGNGRRERGMEEDNHVRRRSEMHNLREDEVRKPNTCDSTRRDRAHLKHERRENKEGLYQLTARLMKYPAGSTDRIPSQRGNRLQQVELSPEEDPDAPHQLVPCNVCHRCFARERLETHMRVCEKKRPQRKIFDMSQYRAKGTELEEFMKINTRSKTPEVSAFQRFHPLLTTYLIRKDL